MIGIRWLSGAVVLVGALLGQISPFGHHAQTQQSSMLFFRQAAARSGVPVPLLIGLAWEQSFLSNHNGRPSIDRGYGLLDLSSRPNHDMLAAAARFAGASPAALRTDDRLNLLGGALVLARYERRIAGGLPQVLGDWARAVVAFTGMRSRLAATLVVDDLYGALRRGIKAEGIHLAPIPDARPDVTALGVPVSPLVRAGAGDADYPGAVWEPANYNNYTDANRPEDHPVRYIVIHDTESSCASAVNWFQDAASQASAHYVICADGTVIQTVHEHDIAWHAGNWPVNQEAIGIEHEGYEDGAYYTRAQYLASAALVRYLCQKYHLNPDRNVIFGHENVPAADHTDPGPNWNWSFYLQRVRHDGTGYAGGSTSVALITSGTQVYSCPQTTCAVSGSANWGEQFVITHERPGWEQIWYGGANGWIPATDVAAGSGEVLRTKTGATLRAGPDVKDDGLGVVLRGQSYVSTVRDGAFWYIAYNHRYAFLPASAVQVIDCMPGHIAGCLAPSGSSLAVTPNAASAGMPLSVEGEGLAPNALVTITIGGEVAGNAQTDTAGSFAANIVLPTDLAPGKRTVSAADSAGGMAIKTKLKVLAAPSYPAQLTLSRLQVLPGSGSVVTGRGLPPEAAVTVRATFMLIDGGTKSIVAHTFTQPDGSLASVNLNVPPKAQPGTYAVLARAPGATGQASLSVVIATPTPTATPPSTVTPSPTPTPTAPPTPTPTFIPAP